MSQPRTDFDLQGLDARSLTGLANRLREVGFEELSVRRRLALRRLDEISLDAYPYYLRARLNRGDPLDVCIRLFMLQQVVTVESLATLLDRSQRLLLKRLGVLLGQKSTRSYRAALSLTPQRKFLIFSDHKETHLGWLQARRPQSPVPAVDAMSHDLMRAIIRRPVSRALDLCCGAAFHALYCSRFSEQVVAIDNNPRAVALAKLNVAFNGVTNVEVRRGDLFAPCKGERFGLIVSAPPSSPSPGLERTERDGGPTGGDTLRRLLSELPKHLENDGYAQLAVDVAERDGESYLDRLRRWLHGANANLHALRTEARRIDAYAAGMVRGGPPSDELILRADLARWIDSLCSQRFKRVISAIVSLEPNQDPHEPPWSQEDETKRPHRFLGDDLQQLFEARRRTRRSDARRRLDQCIPGLPDDLVLCERRIPDGTGLVSSEFRVTWRDPALTEELEIKPMVRDLLELVDNRRRVPEILSRYARDRGVPMNAVDQRGRQAFLAMFERGLITLDEIPATASKAEQLFDERMLDDVDLPEFDADAALFGESAAGRSSLRRTSEVRPPIPAEAAAGEGPLAALAAAGADPLESSDALEEPRPED